METNTLLTRVHMTLATLANILVHVIRVILLFVESIYRMVVPAQEKSVKDQLVLITGAGHGIGRELSLQLSALGARLALWDMDLGRCEQTVKEVRALGGRAEAFCCDVSDRAKVMEVAEETKKKLGNVTILINNAGIMPCKKLLDHTEGDIRKLFDVNVLAHFWMLEAFIPGMRAEGKGHVVALSSMAGILGLINLVPYCASKFAVRGLMEALSEEVRQDPNAPDIKFTTIYPFIVNTGLVHKPRVRFPKLLGVVAPRDAARCIIQAMRRDVQELSIPSPLFHINNFARTLPIKLAYMMRDVVDSGCDPHDN